jgi:N-acetyl-anhydromuramyl-L-alanine amidase AmpD
MSDQQSNFTNFEALDAYIQNKVNGSMLITYRNCKDYEGMVLAIAIIFDIRQAKYELDLQWISFGLDLYGENLLENYLYQFESLNKLLAYLLEKYNIKVTAIPVNYKIDPGQYPDPIKDEAKKLLFEAAWQQFQRDFKSGVFLDTSLKLVYDTHGQ